MKAVKENIEKILSKLQEGYSVDLIDANETGKYRSIFISPYEKEEHEDHFGNKAGPVDTEAFTRPFDRKLGWWQGRR